MIDQPGLYVHVPPDYTPLHAHETPAHELMLVVRVKKIFRSQSVVDALEDGCLHHTHMSHAFWRRVL